MTAHGGQTSAVQTYGDRPWIAIDTVYSYKPDLGPELAAAYRARPIRPFVLIESIYEGEHDSRPEQIRRQAWTAMLSGAAGQFFGNNPMWHFDGPTLFPFAGDWRQALDSPGARDMTRLAGFLAARPWWSLEPDLDSVAVTRSGGPDQPAVYAARTPDRRLAVVYVPADGTTNPRELTMALAGRGAPAALRWFNPARDETPRDVEVLRSDADGLHVRTPGDNGTGTNDWVLEGHP